MDPADTESVLPRPVHHMVWSLGLEVLDLPRGVWGGGKNVSYQEISQGQSLTMGGRCCGEIVWNSYLKIQKWIEVGRLLNSISVILSIKIFFCFTV